jgi:hypothetical protein
VFAAIASRLVDATTGQPMPSIHVILKGPTASATVTDGRGRFAFRNLRPGPYTLTLQSTDVPRQKRSLVLRAGQTFVREIRICSTTLDYSCGGGSSGGAGV